MIISQYVKDQREWLKKTGIKQGSEVTIMDLAHKGQWGWTGTWTSMMNSTIGKIMTFKRYHGCNGLELEYIEHPSITFSGIYPYYVLMPKYKYVLVRNCYYRPWELEKILYNTPINSLGYRYYIPYVGNEILFDSTYEE